MERTHFEWGLISRFVGGGVAADKCRETANVAVPCLSSHVRSLLLQNVPGDSCALNEDGLLCWDVLLRLSTMSNEKACVFMLATASALNGLACVRIPDDVLSLLDLHGSGEILEAWRRRDEDHIYAGLLVLCHLEAFVKQHLPVHWTQSRLQLVPHRISDLIVHPGFVVSP
jgi:hypothetical protein